MSESAVKNSKVTHHMVDQESAGQRIDNFLLRLLKGVPKSYIYRILRKGEVRVNKGRIKASYKIQAGDDIRIPPIRRAEKSDGGNVHSGALKNLENAIINEDNKLILLNKPSGMAVHGGSGLSYGVIEALRQLKPEQRNLELAHRLDRETSGCLVITKKRSALRNLHELIRENRVDKRYLALVAGSFPQDRLEVNQPLKKNTLQGGERVVKVSADGKPATTHFRVLKRFANATLVEARLVTGRTHQIRVHSAHVGTPILGDDKYGDAEANKYFRKLGLKRLFLHAVSLGFKLQDEEDRRRYDAPLENQLQQLLDVLADG